MAWHRTVRSPNFLLVCTLGLGCGLGCADGTSAIRLTITSDLARPSPLLGVEVLIQPQEGRATISAAVGLDRLISLVPNSEPDLPLTIAIQPLNGMTDRRVRIVVKPALDEADPSCDAPAEYGREQPFRSGEVIDLVVDLQCCPTPCPDGMFCTAGARGPGCDYATADAGVDAGLEGILDGAPGRDDAAGLDGGNLDAETLDGGPGPDVRGTLGLGAEHSCTLRGGSLYCWGDNAAGQLGIGMTSGFRVAPQRVGTSSDWLLAAAG